VLFAGTRRLFTDIAQARSGGGVARSSIRELARQRTFRENWLFPKAKDSGRSRREKIPAMLFYYSTGVASKSHTASSSTA
jgi:hypothetical protein